MTDALRRLEEQQGANGDYVLAQFRGVPGNSTR
jgi:hypothetical protein